jgi:hypothetical protein
VRCPMPWSEIMQVQIWSNKLGARYGRNWTIYWGNQPVRLRATESRWLGMSNSSDPAIDQWPFIHRTAIIASASRRTELFVLSMSVMRRSFSICINEIICD